jgi:hypothetical protein
MAQYFELTTDVFKERFDSLSQGGPTVNRAGAPSVRRPMRGLEVKEDTYAMLKVIDLLGREIKLYDSGSYTGKATAYTNFILQAVQEVRGEKYQVVETFGDPYIFFFGESPRFLECSAVLINSQDFNWQAEFWENYDQYLRGSRCAELGARIYMFYDDKVVEGYMVNAAAANDAQNPLIVQLQFKLFLTNYRNISMVGDPRFPIRLGVDVSMATTSMATSADRASSYEPTPTGPNIDWHTVRDTPIRSLIYDNKDEWTGTQPPIPDDTDVDETDDLIRIAVEKAAENAANMDRVDTLASSGLTNANSGQGTGGGTAPVANGSLAADDTKGCVTSEFTRNGRKLCTGADGKEIDLGFDCTTVADASCPTPPPVTPAGSTPKANYPATTNNSMTGQSVQPAAAPAPQEGYNYQTGAFASSVVPEKSQPKTSYY